jgi:hypothetical protein
VRNAEELPGKIGESRAVSESGHENRIKEGTRCLMGDKRETIHHKKQDMKCGASTVSLERLASLC